MRPCAGRTLGFTRTTTPESGLATHLVDGVLYQTSLVKTITTPTNANNSGDNTINQAITFPIRPGYPGSIQRGHQRLPLSCTIAVKNPRCRRKSPLTGRIDRTTYLAIVDSAPASRNAEPGARHRAGSHPAGTYTGPPRTMNSRFRSWRVVGIAQT